MPTRTNKRIIYAQQAITIRPDGQAGLNLTKYDDLALGVQEVGIATNFKNTPYFELGQLEIYEDVEELPDIEVNVSKALDGRPLLYHMATSTSGLTAPTLGGRQNAKCILRMGIYPDTNDYSTGTPPSIVECSGLFPSSLRYQFPVGGTFNESMTLVGNDKIWKADADITNSADLSRSNALSLALTTQFSSDVSTFTATSNSLGTIGITGIQRRQHMNFTPWTIGTGTRGLDANSMVADPFCTVLPPEVDGISASGTNNKTDGQNFDAHIQNISISVDLGREQLDELGRRGPYHRFVRFPVEVTSSIEVISTSGDMVSATEGGILSTSQAACASQSNLSNRTIRVATCHQEVFYLGTKNKLTSVQYGGGGVDGGNVSVTYNYRNYNKLTVMALSDPHDNSLSARYGSTASEFWVPTGVNGIPGNNYLVN